MRKVGVEVQWFRREISPFTLASQPHAPFRRMHRKLAVMDGKVAFFRFGINIIRDIPANFLKFDAPRLDYAVAVTGRTRGRSGSDDAAPVGDGLLGGIPQARQTERLAPGYSEKTATPIPMCISCCAITYGTGENIERAYLKAIAAAKSEVIIANAYFLPGRLFIRALVHAAQARGAGGRAAAGQG